MTTMHPPTGHLTLFFTPWSERVNRQSKGAVTVELRHGLTLANYTNVYSRVQDDVVQIGLLLHGVAGGQFPLTEVAALPFVARDAEEGSVTLWRLYNSGLLDSEYREIVPLQFLLYPPLRVHLTRAQGSLDNLNGLKMAVSSKSQGDTAQRLGGAPVSLIASELYEALQRGTVNGVLTGWGAFPQYKLDEVTSFHIDVPLGSSTTSPFMTRKRFNALPAEAREAIESNSGEGGSRAQGKFLDDRLPEDIGRIATDPKHTTVKLTAAQEAQWRQMVEPVLQSWVNSRPDGDKVLAAYRSLVAEYRAQGGR